MQQSIKIHPTAIIDVGAEVDGSVVVGPYVVIGSGVSIDSGNVIGPYCHIDGNTTIGKDNIFYRYCSIGSLPQDKKYNGEKTYLQIGSRNTIREFTTFNVGTSQGGYTTLIGDDNWIMAYVHIAHDCRIGNHITLANSVQLGGHVIVEDWSVIGGLSGVHQFSRIGKYTMIGAKSALKQDVPPFVLCGGNPARPFGINLEGLKRRGFSEDVILEIKRAYRIIYRQGFSLQEACHCLSSYNYKNQDTSDYIKLIVDFLQNSERGIIRS
ncbi:acyl-ACP--UDP-N-acetylglucosamine O-acyltransferase [Candidatus Kinetoplastidibacterium crithidiae]|uniref:Acyl-[acyl-carrier-protein]--UDP-N-acetylglucosamine O-acyltransferase n=1 Tax=Candidatus Kinetoplastidibacterium crithidiae TCC036E TaxID=1208918 RepID=M1LWM2_9PROT|nr:acyl-ACP--UDP-N-acetylglucosamine O-acyltransferase [Candidatus Kinetoplastibacterium crithidii]AFZ82730.1 UDP-N-acetylglucosamine acyltransferase [Candidatus Kinetoplastibacterium crithidii (ex Angomonas deanei ATCC 30255)]AGF47619.1 UDP-N-acetylglucosamine acyltransferase [Candidatus Kinetoplastibacterium crithidii TCC036E]